jgi:hypothetical protein
MTDDALFSAALKTLTDAQLDYVSTGLELNFGTVLSGNSGDDGFFLNLENGRIVALDKNTITVGDAWKVAEALSQ